MGLIHGFRGLVYVQGVSLDTHSASIQRPFQLNATITPSNATNQNIVWTSSNTNIATVDNSGLVTPVGEGNCTITITLDGHSDSCTLAVSPIRVTGVTLDKNSISVNIGETEQLTATVNPSDASNPNVTWSSSNTSIATVNSTGLVTAIGKGTVTITVTTQDGGYTATCAITCKSEETITVNFDSTTEVTNAGFVFQAIDYGGLTVSGGSLVVNANHNDSGGLIYKDISSYDKWTFQTRVYFQGTDWGGDQHISVAGGDFTGNVRGTNGPQHYFTMTTYRGYIGNSGISDGTTGGNEYGTYFTGRYVYEISYDNGTYTLTRYNDTSEVTESSTYTHRKTFTGLGKAGQVGMFIRTGFTYQNYNKADWMKLIYYS